MKTVDLDRAVETAWRAFEHRLMAGLIELGTGEEILLAVPTGDGASAVSVTFTQHAKTVKIVEVRPAGAAPPALGCGAPRGRLFRLGDEAVAVRWVVGHLRETHEVMHPAFLVCTDPGGTLQPRRRTLRQAATRTGGRLAGRASERRVLVPHSPDELDDVVLRTLARVVDSPLVRDKDGDIPIQGEHGTVYVRVRRDKPVVEVFAKLRAVDDVVADLALANARNVRSPLATFVVMKDLLVVKAAVWSHPFPPTLLLEVIDALMDLLATEADGDDPLPQPMADATRAPMSRATFHDPAGDGGSADLGAPMLTLLQLDAGAPGSVSADLAAKIFGFDTDRLLAGIRTAEGQVIAWNDSGSVASSRDREEADVCTGEATAWQATVDLLRAALRLTVER